MCLLLPPWHYTSTTFKIVFWSLVFIIFSMSAGMLSKHPAWGSQWFLNLELDIIYQLWNILSHNLFKYCLCPLFPPLLWDIRFTCLDFFTVSYMCLLLLYGAYWLSASLLGHLMYSMLINLQNSGLWIFPFWLFKFARKEFSSLLLGLRTLDF